MPSIRTSSRAALLESLAIDEVTFEIEEAVDVAVYRSELLERFHLSEAQHRSRFAVHRRELTCGEQAFDA